VATRRNVLVHGLGRLRAGTAIGIGLLLALGATVAPLPSPTGAPGASLTVQLPGAVRTLVLTLLVLSAVLLLAVQRPRRRTGDEPLIARAAPRRPGWVAVLPVLLTVAVFWYLVWHYWSGGDTHPIHQAFTAIAELLELLTAARKPPTSVPLFDFTIGTLLVLFALGLFALMVLVALADRLERWWRGRTAAASLAAAPAAAHDDDGGDLRAEPDARAAVIRAYGRFERALAGARAPRAPWQTPMEFMRAALSRLSLPVLPVARLTTLFEVARFSDRALGDAARDAACDCLDEITAALATEARPPDAADAEQIPLPGPAHPPFEPGSRSGTTQPPLPGPAHPRFEPGSRSGTELGA
jgi:hypothetical protein